MRMWLTLTYYGALFKTRRRLVLLGSISPSVVSCCVYDKPQKFLQQMHGNIQYMFDYWADPKVDLFILKSSIPEPT